MATLPVRWQGATRSGEIRSALEAALQAWCRQWAVAPVAVGISIPDSRGALRSVGEGERSLAAGTNGRLLLELDSTSESCLGAFFAGVEPNEAAKGMAEGIGRRALDDLCEQILGEMTGRSEVPVSGLSQVMEAFSERRGGVAARCTIDGHGFTVRVDAGTCDVLVPASRPAGMHLADRRQAVLGSEALVEAILDLGSLAVADASMLVPGEVIKTRAPLAAEVRVMTGQGRVLATGSLVADRGQRAVQISTVNLK